MFGLPGDQTMHLLDALYDGRRSASSPPATSRAPPTWPTATPTAAADPGVAFVVPGVGVYNAASGLATAYACSSPVLLLAGQVNRDGIGKDLGLLHDIHDQLDIVRPITKWATRVLEPDELPGAVHEAFARVAAGRPRPVEVEMPPEAFSRRRPTVTLSIEPSTSSEAADPDASRPPRRPRRRRATAAHRRRWRRARRRHRGVHRRSPSCCRPPVVTTREGKGAIDDRNPLSVGTMWVNRRLRPVLDDADVVLAVGTRFQGFGLGRRTQHRRAPRRRRRRRSVATTPVDVARRRRRRAALELLLATRSGAWPRAAPQPRADEVRGDPQAGRGPSSAPSARGRDRRGAPRRDPRRRRRSCPTPPPSGYMCHMHYPVYEPRTYLPSSYMGTLGFAFPDRARRQGRASRRPGRVCDGDGGFLFTATEMATAVQYGINTVTVVFDDGAYGNSNRDPASTSVAVRSAPSCATPTS